MKIIFSYIVLLLVLITPLLALADDANPPATSITLMDPFGCQSEAVAGSPCFVQILQGLIGRILVVVYPILAGMVFYGGLQMMFARGSAEKYKSGLKTIQYAVIGFVVIVVSQGIGLVLHDLLTLRGS